MVYEIVIVAGLLFIAFGAMLYWKRESFERQTSDLFGRAYGELSARVAPALAIGAGVIFIISDIVSQLTK